MSLHTDPKAKKASLQAIQSHITGDSSVATLGAVVSSASLSATKTFIIMLMKNKMRY